MARAGVAVDRELRAGRRRERRGAWVRRSRAPHPGARSPATGSRWPRAIARPSDPRPVRPVAEDGAVTVEHDVLGELMRGSLDHCVKCTICETYCPVADVTPLFPGPKYDGPQAERFRVAGEESRRRVARLLLELRHLHAGLPAGRAHRRDQLAGAGEAEGQDGSQAARPAARRPDWAGRAGTPVAPIANWTLGNRLVRAAARAHRRYPPRRRDAARTRGARSSAGPASTPSPAGARRVVVLPRLRGELVRARHRARRRSSCSSGTAARSTSRAASAAAGCRPQSNGMFDAARTYVKRLAGTLAPAARAGVDIVGTSTSCTLMLKREAREILEMEDDAELRDGRASACSTSASTCSALHDRGELRTDFQPLPITVTYHAPCQQQGHGIGKPALDLMALVPELRVIENDATCCGVAGTYGLKAREVRHRDGGRAPACSGRSPTPGPSSRCATRRPAAGTSRRRPACSRSTRSRSSTAPPA